MVVQTRLETPSGIELLTMTILRAPGGTCTYFHLEPLTSTIRTQERTWERTLEGPWDGERARSHEPRSVQQATKASP